MLGVVLPYTSSLTRAVSLSYGFSTYDSVDSTMLVKVTRALIDTISIVAICYSVVSVADEKGADKATLYATILTVLAFTLPRLFMESIVTKLCKDCPANGIMSTALVTLIVIMLIEQGIRAML